MEKIVYLIGYNNSIYHDLLQAALKGNGFYIYESAKAKLDDQIQIAENYLNCREDT